MKGLKKPERNAIEAVAKHFSATWESGSGFASAYLRVAGKRIAVDIKSLPKRGAQRNAAKPHLRFDRVATGLVERLRASHGETVPAGVTVLLTLTAPILLPAKTTASLEDKYELFSSGDLRVEMRKTRSMGTGCRFVCCEADPGERQNSLGSCTILIRTRFYFWT